MQDNGQKTSEDKDKDKKEKEKKPKLALGKVLSDNVFVLKMVHRAAPWYMPTYFGWSVFGSIVNFLSGSYLLRLVINHLQASKSLTAVLIYIGIIFGLNVLYRIVIGWISNKLYPRYNMKIVEEFQRVLFDKARAVELSCYEDPAFYDKYVKVMDTAYNRSMNVIYALDRLIWNGVSFFANAALLYIIDPSCSACFRSFSDFSTSGQKNYSTSSKPTPPPTSGGRPTSAALFISRIMPRKCGCRV